MESIFLSTDFISRTQIIQYNKQQYKIVTSKYDLIKLHPLVDDCVLSSIEYKVYNIAGDEITKCIVKYIRSTEEFINYCHDKVYIAEVPNEFIELASINTKQKHQNKGYASLLINYVIGDCLNLSKCLGVNLKMIILRQNNPATYPLYAKFNAKENCGNFRFYSYTPLIINNIQKVQKYNANILKSDYQYQNQL